MGKNDLAVDDKKKSERLYLDRFVEVWGPLPKGKILDFEQPDFLIVGEQVLGIELTRLFHKSAQGQSLAKEQESLRRKILTRVKSIYDAFGIPPIYVTVSFNLSSHLRKNEVERLAQAIAELGRRLFPAMNETASEEYTWDNREYFPDEVSRISTIRFPALDDSFWGLSGAAWRPETTSTRIQAEIDLKGIKLPKYLKSCAKVWLILCVSGEGMSSWFDISGEALTIQYQSPFERVFWFSYQGKVHELNIRGI